MWARLTSEKEGEEKERKEEEKKKMGRRSPPAQFPEPSCKTWAGPIPQAGLLSRVLKPAFLAVNRAGHSFEPWAKPS